MLRQYLVTAQDDLTNKQELVTIKQQRLSLAKDEFQHLNTTPAEKWDLVVVTDWHGIFRELASCDSPSVDGDDAARANLQRDLERHALATFVDAHNTSYYVNSYTTKVNPSMDDVLCKLLDADGDGSVSWSEVEGGARGLFHRTEETVTSVWAALSPYTTSLLAGAGVRCGALTKVRTPRTACLVMRRGDGTC